MILGFTPLGVQVLGGAIDVPAGTAVAIGFMYFVSGLGWAVNGGRTDLPPGTLVNTYALEWQWLGAFGPPPDAVPMDQFTYDFMTNNNVVGRGYPYWVVRYPVGRGIIPISLDGM
jgi:hypothetical protein